MNLGRAFRTVRYLTPEQWLFRAICRGRWEFARRAPALFRAHVVRTARRLPLPAGATAALREAAAHVLLLQKSVHGGVLDGIAEGRFTFLGRTVDFGGIEKIEWRRDLGEKNNPLWRMNLSYMGWAVPLLARGDVAWHSTVRDVLAGLDRQNPWSAPGVFRDVWHPYSVSHRLINLLSGLALYETAGGPAQPEAAEAVREHARLCAAFLLHNLERDLQFNHLLKNWVALAVYRAALGGPCPRLGMLEREVKVSLRQQLLPDGGQAERAPMYHLLFVLDLMVLDACGFAVAEELTAARHALAVVTHGDGDIALFNDSWLGEGPRASLLGTALPPGSADLPDSGYVRLSDAESTLIFDRGLCGPDSNPGHAHADFLSLEACIGGERFLVDYGVPTYSAGTLRDLCRSAAQHNGPHLAGAEPIEFWYSFRVGRRGRAYPIDDRSLAAFAPLWAAGWQDGYKPQGVAVARWIGFWPGKGMLLVDVWRGESNLPQKLHFLVPSAWQRRDNVFEHARGVRLDVLKGAMFAVEEDRWWPRFGEERPAHKIIVSPVVSGNSAVAATLWHWGPMPPDISQIAEHAASTLSALRWQS